MQLIAVSCPVKEHLCWSITDCIMTQIRITKIFHFEMAHALHGYDGKCAQIHGHSYELSVTILGIPKSEQGNPKLGMVMDFGELKRIVQKEVVSELDHALLLSTASQPIPTETEDLFDRVQYVGYQPTCENLLIDVAARLKSELPKTVTLHSLKLVETPTSFSEWFASDNL